MKYRHYSTDDLTAMADRHRVKFVNSLSGFKSVNLIGTEDHKGQSNLAVFSSVVHLGASPPLVGFVMRPDKSARHTLENIKETGLFTINHVSSDFYQAAHQTSARYPKDESEFVHSGLTTEYIEGVHAPFVNESRLKYAVELRDILPISLNDTQFIIGEIIHVVCDEIGVKKDGYIDIEAMNTVSVSGLDHYHKTESLARLSYAKANKPVSILSIDGEPISDSQ